MRRAKRAGHLPNSHSRVAPPLPWPLSRVSILPTTPMTPVPMPIISMARWPSNWLSLTIEFVLRRPVRLYIHLHIVDVHLDAAHAPAGRDAFARAKTAGGAHQWTQVDRGF